jgi:cytochrome P450
MILDHGAGEACPAGTASTARTRVLWLVAQPLGAPVPELLGDGQVYVPAGGPPLEVIHRRAGVLEVIRDRRYVMAGVTGEGDDRRLRGHPMTGAEQQHWDGGLLNMDGPAHRAIRAPINSVFTKDGAAAERPFAMAAARALAESVAAAREADLAGLADRYAAAAVCHSLGLDDWDAIRDGSDNAFAAVYGGTSHIAAVDAGWAQIYDFYTRVVAAGLGDPRGTVAQITGVLRRFSLEQIVRALANVSNGYPAFRWTLRRVLHELVTTRRALLDDCLAGRVTWLEATSRLVDTVALFQVDLPRRAVADVQLGDRRFAAGTFFLPSLVGAALDGPPLPGIAFGFGPHRCPGDWLTLYLIAVFLEVLFGTYPRIRSTGEPDEWFGGSLAVTRRTMVTLR